MAIPDIHRATENLVEWSARDEWAPLHFEILTDHFEPFADLLEEPLDDVAELLGGAFHMLEVFIAEDFFTAYFGDAGEMNVVDDYLERRGWSETAAGRRYLEGLRDSTVSLYEVTGIDPGRGLSVRDLLLGGETVKVEEKLGSEWAAPWDRVAARVVEVEGKNYFTGAMLHFEHELSQLVLSGFEEFFRQAEREMRWEARGWGGKPPPRAALREIAMRELPCAQMLSEYWLGNIVLRAGAPPPELHNTDGDPMVFCQVRFPVEGDAATVTAVLDGIGDFERDGDGERFWRWLAPGSPMHRMAGRRTGNPVPEAGDGIGTTSLGYAGLERGTLTLAVNSRERAERGRDLLASRLGDLLGPPLISLQDPEKALEEPAGQTPDETAVPTAEAVETMHAWLDDHYRRTLDDPLPMLAGGTLREAAATRKGRKRAMEWLKQLENGEHRRAAQLGHRPYDTAWIWRELGIRRPR